MKKSTIILISAAGAILIIFLAFTIFLGFSIKKMVRSGDNTAIVSDWNLYTSKTSLPQETIRSISAGEAL